MFGDKWKLVQSTPTLQLRLAYHLLFAQINILQLGNKKELNLCKNVSAVAVKSSKKRVLLENVVFHVKHLTQA